MSVTPIAGLSIVNFQGAQDLSSAVQTLSKTVTNHSGGSQFPPPQKPWGKNVGYVFVGLGIVVGIRYVISLIQNRLKGDVPFFFVPPINKEKSLDDACMEVLRECVTSSEATKHLDLTKADDLEDAIRHCYEALIQNGCEDFIEKNSRYGKALNDYIRSTTEKNPFELTGFARYRLREAFNNWLKNVMAQLKGKDRTLENAIEFIRENIKQGCYPRPSETL
jgi:hypothetical protein